MFDRVRRSWSLTKASFAVLRADRELLIFPLISFFALVLVLISYALPLALVPGMVDFDRSEISPAGMALTFLFYVVSYTVSFYFNTALVGAAMIRLNGGDPSVRDGLRIASSRLPQIIGFAIIAATVGMILRLISERAGWVGRIIIGFIGMAWAILTFLVVPVLAAEGVGPIAAIKRSGELLRKTWGEQLFGGAGIGLVFGLITFAAFGIGGAITAAVFKANGYLGMVALVVTILVIGAIALIGAALGGIFRAALYQYATKGASSSGFDESAMSDAFRPKGAPSSGGLKIRL